MKVILLGEPARRLNFSRIPSAQFFHVVDPATLNSVLNEQNIDLLISYGYRHILSQTQLKLVNGLALNLHIGLLPFNRGAHPNLWSNLENTPSGVTIHEISLKVDEGPIIFQEEVSINEDSTFKESYELLSNSIEQLFFRNCEALLKNELTTFPQVGEGSFHREKDLFLIQPILSFGWDTRVKDAKLEYLKFLELRGYSELHCIHKKQLLEPSA